MPRKIEWTAEADDMIRAGRAGGRSWDAISGELGLSRWAVLLRGRFLGAARKVRRYRRGVPPPAKNEREPLPAGHPLTWGAITAGTVLAGAPYRYSPPVTAGGPDASTPAAEQRQAA